LIYQFRSFSRGKKANLQAHLQRTGSSYRIPSLRSSQNKDYKHVDYRRQYAVLADGLSGGNHGGEAAYHAVQTINLYLPGMLRQFRRNSTEHEAIQQRIRNLLLATNELMYSISHGFEQYHDWGTTLDLCVLVGDRAYLGHVGDGSVFHLDRCSGEMKKLTEDHSIEPPGFNSIPEHLKAVALLNSPLTNYMGGKDAEVDVIDQEIGEGDMLLMASDGLTKLVSQENLEHILRTSKGPDEARSMLIERLPEYSDYAGEFMDLRGVDIEDAGRRLIDDVTFILIGGIEDGKV